jgi:hypothetical protein
MAPIYESDIAEERWSKEEWKNYELWEKVEVRLRKRKWGWIAGTIALFLVLSSVPIVMDQAPKWGALVGVRQLAQEVNRLKRDASIDHVAYRLRFSDPAHLSYVIERSSSCSDPVHTVVRTGSLMAGRWAHGYAVMTRSIGQGLGVPGLVESFCYDYLAGSDAVLAGSPTVGFGISPVKDLAEARMDRVAILLLSGPSAEISFE